MAYLGEIVHFGKFTETANTLNPFSAKNQQGILFCLSLARLGSLGRSLAREIGGTQDARANTSGSYRKLFSDYSVQIVWIA
jgi:hypothetical protein